MSNNEFWIENPSILIEKDELVNFVPTKNMSLVQKMNAITRFCLYGLLIGMIFNFQDNIMYILFVIIIMTIISYKLNETPNTNSTNNPNLFNSNQIDTLSTKLSEVLINNKKNLLENFNKGNAESTSENNVVENGNKCNAEPTIKDTSGDNIQVKLEDPLNKDNEQNELKQLNELSNKNCKTPTNDNPLMNVNIGDNPLNHSACEYSDEIKENINKKLNYNLYQDVDDLFGRYNSQRQFYTMPSTTVPNDQKSFAEWLYKTPETCKENSLCLKYEDNRYNK